MGILPFHEEEGDTKPFLFGGNEVKLDMRGGCQSLRELVCEELVIEEDLLKGLALCRLLRGFSCLVLSAYEVTSLIVTSHGTEDMSSPTEEDLRRPPAYCGGRRRATDRHLEIRPIS